MKNQVFVLQNRITTKKVIITTVITATNHFVWSPGVCTIVLKCAPYYFYWHFSLTTWLQFERGALSSLAGKLRDTRIVHSIASYTYGISHALSLIFRALIFVSVCLHSRSSDADSLTRTALETITSSIGNNASRIATAVTRWRFRRSWTRIRSL